MAMYEGGSVFQTPYIEYGYAIQNYAAQYTIISYKLSPASGQMDFQVQALEGYPEAYRDMYMYRTYVSFSFYGESSSWSNTQTISFPDGKVTTSLNTDPTPTVPATPIPSVPEYSMATIPLLLMAATATIIVFLMRKRS